MRVLSVPVRMLSRFMMGKCACTGHVLSFQSSLPERSAGSAVAACLTHTNTDAT